MMNKIFGQDSPLSRAMTTAWSLIILNLLTLLTCIPIITGGAALSALHYCLIRIIRKEDGYMSTMFFRAFKENFKKSTILWLIVLFIAAAIRIDWVMITADSFHYMLMIVGIVSFFLFQYVFALQAHFENTIFNTIKNSFILCIARFPRTFVMAAVWVIPFAILKFSLALFPLLLLLGISMPAYVGARMYEPVFKMLEPPEETEDTENMHDSAPAIQYTDTKSAEQEDQA